MKTITSYVPEDDLNDLAELIRRKIYPSRSEIIRLALRDLLHEELPKLKDNPPV